MYIPRGIYNQKLWDRAMEDSHHRASSGRIQRKSWYNLTLCPLQSRLQHVYHGQLNAREPYARVDFIPKSGTLDLASVCLSAQLMCVGFDLGLPAVLIPQLGEETDPNLRLDFSEASWIGTYILILNI